MIGGFGNAGMPSALIDALLSQGARGLTIVNNSRQAAGDPAHRGRLLPPCRLVLDDARRAPRHLRAGAFQVSGKGDLANWHTGAPDAIPAVGGAMDLTIGAKQVFVMMEHQTKTGESKIVDACTYPLTGIGGVDRIYTDLAVLDVTADGLRVLEMAPGLTLQDLQAVTAARLLPPLNKENPHA